MNHTPATEWDAMNESQHFIIMAGAKLVCTIIVFFGLGGLSSLARDRLGVQVVALHDDGRACAVSESELCDTNSAPDLCKCQAWVENYTVLV